MTDNEKRKLYRAWAENICALKPFPADCRGLTCGATTRKGTPCKITALFASGRCKLHGGMSTGAKTAEGKARQLEGYRRWREKQLQTDSEADGS
ncbi:hypothetical protein D4S68_18740 [Salmonella enterica]|uniref:Uncharacterized protein n=10 Tax=Salmonella enterica TaxID=28901 RepID=A0A3Y7R0M4_SALDE|nr:HGGxSTG domain-containing protein [Salmonella enterica]APW13298.1 hypothetical protein SEEM0315_000580 [Salmonella enterica subsp. enterica serovar Muenster str. 0315]AUM47843.1 hypothetical protein SEEM0420_000580 [Salmonella enterica subsp. enterica serovar Muenster str. 420]EAA0501291.1 hypothetical protein [Salmonella enterica subsp. enterica serovar Orion]EAB6377064.1 hypothetical protein [Salmonella enterica subsp. enterica serovar Emek]EAU3190033.1 hypothetical protein [Salmonella en